MALTYNYAVNPSGEVNAADWGGPRPVVRVPTVDAAHGAATLRLGATATGQELLIFSTSSIPASQRFMSFRMMARSYNSASAHLRFQVAFLNSVGANIGGTQGPIIAATGDWQELVVADFMAPAAATAVLTQVIVVDNAGALLTTTNPGYYIEVDALTITDGPNPLAYTDGNSPGWVWTGAAGNSASRQHAEVIATPLADMDPVPRVECIINGVVAPKVTLWRTTEGERAVEVRGAIRQTGANPMTLTDFEAPFSPEGVTSTYRLEFLDANNNSLGYATPVEVELAFTGTVIQQPLEPSRAALVENASTRRPTRNRPLAGELVKVPAAARPVWVGAGRDALKAVPLTFRTLDEAQYHALARVFGDYGEAMSGVVCIRTSETVMRLPQPFFCVVTDPMPTGINWHMNGWITEWAWSADEAAPPANGIITPPLSYDDLSAAYSTYDGFTSDNESYASAARRYEFSELT